MHWPKYLPNAERWRMSGPGHTSLTHVRRSPHGWRLLAFNATFDVVDA